MLSSTRFIASGLTLRSLIHFEFIFVYGAGNCFFSPIRFIQIIYIVLL